MDKVTIKFFADVLYIKGVLCYEEYNDILESSCTNCLDIIVEKMLRDNYNPYTRGDIVV